MEVMMEWLPEEYLNEPVSEDELRVLREQQIQNICEKRIRKERERIAAIIKEHLGVFPAERLIKAINEDV